MISLLVGLLTVSQGQAVELRIAHRAEFERVSVEWRDRTHPLVRLADSWVTVVGVDLDVSPGSYAAHFRFELAGGEQSDYVEDVLVTGRDFPTTSLEVEPRFVELDPADQDRAAREATEITGIYSRLTPERYWNAPFTVPLPGITGGRNFGHRRIFNGQSRAPHSGADLRAASGTPVRAANRGRVVLAKELFFSGNAVFLDHGLGVYSVYLHLSEIGVEPGDLVEREELIGHSGATGRVTGPHLHWGVRVLDARVDPFSLLDLGVD